jgi:hypothetical protein
MRTTPIPVSGEKPIWIATLPSPDFQNVRQPCRAPFSVMIICLARTGSHVPANTERPYAPRAQFNNIKNCGIMAHTND